MCHETILCLSSTLTHHGAHSGIRGLCHETVMQCPAWLSLPVLCFLQIQYSAPEAGTGRKVKLKRQQRVASKCLAVCSVCLSVSQTRKGRTAQEEQQTGRCHFRLSGNASGVLPCIRSGLSVFLSVSGRALNLPLSAVFKEWHWFHPGACSSRL